MICLYKNCNMHFLHEKQWANLEELWLGIFTNFEEQSANDCIVRPVDLNNSPNEQREMPPSHGD